MKFWIFSSKPSESWIWGGKMWQAFKSRILILDQVFAQDESSARQNGVPFSQQQRKTRVALVKATKNKAKCNLATDEVHV